MGVAAAGLGLAAVAASQVRADGASNDPSASPAPFRYALNTSTIRGQKLPLDRQIEIAAEAGYDGIEPWIGDIDQFVAAGGSLKDMGKKAADLGLGVESAIGFAEWIVDDDERRAKGLAEARRNMDMLVELGGKRIAAPPAGATDQADLNLLSAAERYRALLELGAQTGIVPQVEVWGFSRCLSRLGETALVALESKHPQCCLLLDVYHLYKGGSDFSGLKLLAGAGMHVFHVNDYPDIARDKITDADRVYPGDGVAPLAEIFRQLRENGFAGVLSLELFNRAYWQQDPMLVARTGLEKTKDAVAAAFG